MDLETIIAFSMQAFQIVGVPPVDVKIRREEPS